MQKLLTLLLCLFAGIAAAQNLSPYDFGLREANSDSARYQVLYNTHCAAVEAGVDVDYTGITELHLELPHNAKSIPLTQHNDFKGLTIYIRNNVEHKTLFSRSMSTQPITLDPVMVDSGDFTSVPQLAQGTWLLILSDKNVWTERQGFGYQVWRKDILLIQNGRSINRPVASYNTPSTQLQCSYCPATEEPTTFENITLIREKGNAFRSYLVSCSNLNNVQMRNLHLVTPKSKMTGDAAIGIQNCTNVDVRDVVIDGTYSKSGTGTGYGYGFSLGNLYHSTFTHVVGDAPWGVFGSNNMSDTRLEDCHVNRFDIHCYGRDVYCKNCYFHTKQTLFSSFYGTLTFDSCTFHDYVPVRIRSSYNAYTGFDIVMKDCTFDANLQHHAIVSIMLLDSTDNPRPELKEKCWPNITIENLMVNVPLYLSKVVLFDPIDNTYICKDHAFGYLNNIALRNVRMRNGRRTSHADFQLTSVPTALTQPLTLDIHVDTKGKVRYDFK